MMLDVSHRTYYQYSSPVVQSQHLIHLTPRSTERQAIRHHSLIIEPAPATRFDSVDAFGNHMAILDIELPHKEFVLHARTTVETIAPPAFDFAKTTPWDKLDGVLAPAGKPIPLDVVQYRCVSRLTTASLGIAEYAAQSFTRGRPVLQGAMDLTLRIYDEFTFDSTATDVSTPIHEVFRHRRGVCQDFAHFALACCRAMRVPARYVSGYILTRPPPGQPRLQGADASHAWISVWSPQTGWIDLDPTNGIAVSDEHVMVACGRDYEDVSPISGLLLGGGDHDVNVGVDVVPV
ncbi:MAG: transglutaminase family protein [Hyphomicrobiaceae bacterium]|jgi:transglutaminase-like putative cysteine protease|nr:transglutaminase family protein [Hyphomicrobiaceae bacterium]